jgi:hypothetical protein
MKNKLLWFINRARTISLPEWGYRIKQQLLIKKEQLLPNVPQGKLLTIELPPVIKFADLPSVSLKNEFKFFAYSIDITKPLNFHLDVSSGKSFPMSFSKKINMRSDAYGSAKVVWEVNRLQFLLPLILDYKRTHDVALLDRFVTIMTEWDVQNPYLKGVNWYSNIEVNIRLINWYWCWLLLADDEIFLKGEAYTRFKNDIWVPLVYKHCHYSYHNPSFYSSANNHLISEYAGLFIASSLWKFKESANWSNYARKGLEKEIALQHSPNGINKEEAAEYIQFISDFFLLSYVTARQYDKDFSSAYKSMLINIISYINQFLDVKGGFPKYGDEDDGRLILPDGDTHSNNFISILSSAAVLFNNSSFKRADATWDIKTALLTAFINGKSIWDKLPVSDCKPVSKFYTQEGHFYFKDHTFANKEIYAHMDAASLGFLSIAAHGHADALSFTLTIDGAPILVDPGTFTYHTHPVWRKYFVSTLAHNTITINNKDQAQLAGPTMWLNHFKCDIEGAAITDTDAYVKASHDGYDKAGAGHRRTVRYHSTEKVFYITDEIILKQGVSVDLKMPFHMHPNVFARADSSEITILKRESNENVLSLIVDPAFKWEIITALPDAPLAWYSPSFMIKQPSSVLIGNLSLNSSMTFNTIIKIL